MDSSVNRDCIADEVENPYNSLTLLKDTMVNVDQPDAATTYIHAAELP